MKELLEKVRQGQIRAIARLITRVENNPQIAEEAIQALYPFTGQAHIIGITGSPGAGPSGSRCAWRNSGCTRATSTSS